MDGLAKWTLKFIGYLFALLVVSFTAVQSYSLLYEVSGNPVVAALGVVLFEGGMIYWWYAFQKDAEGLGQLAVALLGAVFGLVLVAGATALHLGAMDGNLLGPQTPARLVTLAAITNLALKFLYPLLSPDTFSAVWVKALEGKVSLKAFREAEKLVDDMAGELASDVGNEIKRRLRVKVLTDYGLAHEGEMTVIPGQATAVTSAAPLPLPLPYVLKCGRVIVAEGDDVLELKTAAIDAAIDGGLKWEGMSVIEVATGRVLWSAEDDRTPSPNGHGPATVGR